MTQIATIAVLAILTFVTIGAAIHSWSAARAAECRTLRERLDPTVANRADLAGNATEILRRDTLSSIPSLNRLLQQFSPATHLGRQLMQAGMRISVINMFYSMGFLALSAALVLQWRFAAPRPAAMIGGTIIGTILPIAYVRRRRKRHLQAFAAQLPAALDMLRSSIHAGHSLDYALAFAVAELSDPIGQSFSVVLDEIRLGLSLREALDNLYRRVPLEELRLFVLAVVLSREVGGSLSEVLGKLAATLRERNRLRQQVRALSAQGRASAILLFIIPPGVALIANLLRPGFVEPLFYNPTGRLLLGVAAAFQIAAILLIHRIINPRELGIT